MKRLRLPIFNPFIFLSIALAGGLWFGALIVGGCAGTNAQRAILVSSSAAATTVNAAYDLWATDAAIKAKTALGPGATPEAIVERVKADGKNRRVMLLYDDWRTAALAFSAANAAASSGTNAASAVSTESFRANMAKAGNSLLQLISQLTGKPQPALLPQ